MNNPMYNKIAKYIQENSAYMGFSYNKPKPVEQKPFHLKDESIEDLLFSGSRLIKKKPQ